jgi:Cu/Ag efflux protein CusF
MRLLAVLFIALVAGSAACSAERATVSPAPATNSASQKNGEYPAKGTITKINPTLGSVELDHEDIPNLMPAMRMEFYLADKLMLNGIAVGDIVDFTILYKDGTETITKIKPR